MKIENQFKGKIFIKTKMSKNLNFEYDFGITSNSLEKTFLNCFEKYNFTTDEKKELTHLNREYICNYESIQSQKFDKYAKELATIINKLGKENNDIELNANYAGAFICLKAIFEGYINNPGQVYFNLQNSPFGLFKFPQTKFKMPSNIVINLKSHPDFWSERFTSLKSNNALEKHCVFESFEYKKAS